MITRISGSSCAYAYSTDVVYDIDCKSKFVSDTNEYTGCSEDCLEIGACIYQLLIDLEFLVDLVKIKKYVPSKYVDRIITSVTMVSKICNRLDKSVSVLLSSKENIFLVKKVDFRDKDYYTNLTELISVLGEYHCIVSRYVYSLINYCRCLFKFKVFTSYNELLLLTRINDLLSSKEVLEKLLNYSVNRMVAYRRTVGVKSCQMPAIDEEDEYC
ncbi:hypothetical protein [Candidatus Ichthyocystis hellenicum]|uniref:hypothetical protein n=1 Tax=Candidatus Ichthyocystis hellenicum TaxID=1561003 RepID=UPI000B833519|nr:hypothetical protein [Candidatus Ichthyocystis hellenicum]